MYCYVLIYWGYEDSMLLPIFHENKYSLGEFNAICQKALEKSKKLNPYTNREEHSIYEVYHKLLDEYGFKSLNDKVLAFNVNDGKVTLLKDDFELDVLLNIAQI